MEIAACISTLQGDEVVKKPLQGDLKKPLYSLYNQIEHAGIVLQLIVNIINLLIITNYIISLIIIIQTRQCTAQYDRSIIYHIPWATFGTVRESTDYTERHRLYT